MGKRIGEWVYEIFITTLPTEGFLVEDVLDLYHGRGAFEAVLADEDVEEDPDRWCSYTECGQELWQVAGQRVWNLRLSLGQTLQKAELREIEWAPSKGHPLCSSWKSQLKRMGRGNGPQRLGEPPDRSALRRSLCKMMEAPLSSRSKPVVERIRQENAFTQRAVYLAYQTDCQPVLFGSSASRQEQGRSSAPGECGSSSLASTPR